MSQNFHAVQQLYQTRLARATKPFISRGHKTNRCVLCQVAADNCICRYKPSCESSAAFCLLMYDDEVLKPSNTGRLIADVIADTHAFIWSRTELDVAFEALIANDDYQPFVVFPRQDVEDGRQIYESVPQIETGKKPLFILLDGTWREARKMFRKTPVLNRLPVISLAIGENPQKENSDYQIRKNAVAGQLATAEVAACLLADFGEQGNGELLKAWFDVFSYHYQLSVTKPNKGNKNALQNLQRIVDGNSQDN